MTIGQRIKLLRMEKGESQAKLSRELALRGVDLSQVAISQLEADLTKGTTHCASIADYFKVNALWLETGKGKQDLDYIHSVEKEYCREIQETIKLMKSTDDRGREKVLIAVKDAVDAHQAWKNSLPRAQDVDVEGDRIEESANRDLGQDAVRKVFENEKAPSGDACTVEEFLVARKGKNH